MADIKIGGLTISLPTRKVDAADVPKFREQLRKQDASDVVFTLGQDTYVTAARQLNVKGIKNGDAITVDGRAGQVTAVDDNSPDSLLDSVAASVKSAPVASQTVVVAAPTGPNPVLEQMKYITSRLNEINSEIESNNETLHGHDPYWLDHFGQRATARAQLESLQTERDALIAQMGQLKNINQQGVITNNFQR